MFSDFDSLILPLRTLQRRIREALIASRSRENLHHVRREDECDTIYEIDFLIEPIIIDFFNELSRSIPLIVIAEGLEPATGRTFPAGLPENKAQLRFILDPIDGTRCLMYDKRPAWSLAGVAPNKGASTRLADIQAAVMTELPTSKMAFSDVLFARRGRGTTAVRESLFDSSTTPLTLHPSTAKDLSHGFATIVDFFPGTKPLAGKIMEDLLFRLLTPSERGRGAVTEDQYTSTAGQLYELITGHDRFIADLRPIFYELQNQPPGLCAHPYDLGSSLIAQEAGVILTDGRGRPLDAPLDLNSNIAWAGFANPALRALIEPILSELLQPRP